MWLARCSSCRWNGNLTSRLATAKAAAHAHEHPHQGWELEIDAAKAFDEEHPDEEWIVMRTNTWNR
jgi:hypothetical protein